MVGSQIGVAALVAALFKLTGPPENLTDPFNTLAEDLVISGLAVPSLVGQSCVYTQTDQASLSMNEFYQDAHPLLSQHCDLWELRYIFWTVPICSFKQR